MVLCLLCKGQGEMRQKWQVGKKSEVFSLSLANYSTEGGLYGAKWGNILAMMFKSLAKAKPKTLTIKNTIITMLLTM